MAQRVQVILEDDLDGTEATETVPFGLDGTIYEIDLNAEHATQLRQAFASWISAARKTRSSGQTRSNNSTASRTRTDPEQLNKVREWGRANGYQVSDRGRVSQQLQDAYQQAQ
ncbi:Lsr2 family protein [Allobranchiibius sp. GilTou73]|uniref:histone-like nucleoid-structuring protein Lsr2 n=1 Tax=Allobranchiibius sp. GilTou73 TaxID=2904523 RepID=UPI001F406470|nr:Lsr2 family protein [Allobranchiibius sp. GilTou73]UIJ35614.1 Lsr2 family protein [Allobranchiibius sp. GilTou73]